MKRIFALALALLLACGVFVACGETKETAASTEQASESSTEAGTESSVTDYYRNIPTEADGSYKQLGGYTFKMYSYKSTGDDWDLYLDPASATGESVTRMQPAAYNRNLELEDYFGCDIKLDTEIEFLNHVSKLRMAISTSDCEWDIACMYGNMDLSTLVGENLLYDWNKLPYVNLTESWYNQTANEVYTIAGKQLMAVSSISLTVHQHSRVLMNKKLFETLGHSESEIYRNVLVTKDWTIEKLATYVKDAYSNVNTEDPGVDVKDRFGMGINASFAADFIISAGVTPVVANEDGFKFTTSNTKIAGLLKTIKDWNNTQDIWFVTPENNNNNWNTAGVVYNIFNEGRSLFSFFASDPRALLTIKTFDYAYLPYPKYNEKQKDYVTVGYGGIILVPGTVKAHNPDATGMLIEAMSAASKKYVYEEFISEYFDTRIIRDPSSLEIYRHMIETATYSVAKYVDPNAETEASMNNFFANLIASGSVSSTSAWNTISKRVENGYKTLFENVKKNINPADQ